MSDKIGDALGPLPSHRHSLNSGTFQPLYTADQMRAYAAQEVAADRKRRAAPPWQTCSHHGAAHPSEWACPACLRELRVVALRMVAGIDHLDKLTREWEPDHSSGADRRGWLLAKDARDDAARVLGLK